MTNETVASAKTTNETVANAKTAHRIVPACIHLPAKSLLPRVLLSGLSDVAAARDGQECESYELTVLLDSSPSEF